MISCNKIIKYVAFALVIGILLKYVKDFNLSHEQIIQIVAISTIFFFLLDNYLLNYKNKEKFDALMSEESHNPELHETVKYFDTIDQKQSDFIIPKTFGLLQNEPEFEKLGIVYDHSKPGYYMINNGEYTNGDIPYAEANNLINLSRLNDLYNQHNHNIVWTPHTHIGKARGYINWNSPKLD